LNLVEIPDDNGTGRKIKLYLASDGDFHISILERDQIVTRNSVRICDGEGNPKHRNLHNNLYQVYREAKELGY